MDLKFENFKQFLKPHARDDPKFIFPSRNTKKNYAPVKIFKMNYFTCEGGLSRLYRYHIKLLMHFTRVKTLDLPHYLYRSLIKMAEKVQSRREDHHTSLFHHGLIKLIVLHHLSSINMTWEDFLERLSVPLSVLPITSSPQPMEIRSSRITIHLSDVPRVVGFSHTYERGRREVFVPKSTRIFLTLDTHNEQC